MQERKGRQIAGEQGHHAKWPRDVLSRLIPIVRAFSFAAHFYSPLSCSSDVYFFTENDIVVSYVHLRDCVRKLVCTFARLKREREKDRDTLETQQNAIAMYTDKYKTATNSILRAITTEYCYGGSATVLCLVAHIARACHLHLSRPITFCRDVNTPYESTRANRCTTTSIKISHFDVLRI